VNEQSAYDRWLAAQGLDHEPPSPADARRQIEELERLAERKERNARHAPNDFDRRRALARADRYDDLAQELRTSLPTPTNPCPGCGNPAPAYDDPCPYCQTTTAQERG
jgi:hypothetical protein